MIYLAVFLIAFLQATAANLIAIGGIKPDLLLIFVVFVVLRRGWAQAAMTGVLAGFLKDILSTGAFLNTLVFPVCGIGAGLFVEKFHIDKENAIVQFAITLSVSILIFLAYLAWFLNWDYPPHILTLTIYVGVPAILYTTLIAPFIFHTLKKLQDAA